jgi:hypothetical protein
MTVPGHIVFIYAIKALQSGNDFSLSLPFAVVYLGAAFLQVLLIHLHFFFSFRNTIIWREKVLYYWSSLEQKTVFIETS